MITSGREPVDLSPLISAWNNQITFPPGHLIFQMVFNVSSFVGVLNSKTNKSMTLVAIRACFRKEKGDFFLNKEGNRDILQASWQIMTKCFGGFSHLSSLCLCENCRSSWLCVRVFVFCCWKIHFISIWGVGRWQNVFPSDNNEINLWNGVMGARLESEGKNLTSSTS